MKKNKATVREVVEAVVIQQVIQTVLGWLVLESEEEILKREINIDHLRIMGSWGYAGNVGKVVLLVLGDRTGEWVIRKCGRELVQWTYWWGVPAAQLLFAL